MLHRLAFFDNYQQDSSQAGCNDFLPKPISSEVLFELLENYLEIEWVYEQQPEQPFTISFMNQVYDKSTTIVAPPSEQLTVLKHLAMRGNIKAILEQVTLIESLDEVFVPFTIHIRNLTKAFQVKQIREFVSKYLEQ
ncbi:MAG: hypothetical protein HC908_16395 [Calothrix sp. SM1_7_51]|nr:hypothetical protein [Calothrix sp. SM1_7_51]